MNSLSPLALELTRLIGSKDTCDRNFLMKVGGKFSYGEEPWDGIAEVESFGVPCQLHDLFRWYEKENNNFCMYISNESYSLLIREPGNDIDIPYNPTLPLYSQSDETLTKIVNLIKVCNT